jgi:voltage-gated potassium channel
MAQVLKRPTVVDFIDIAMMGNQLGLIMEEARVSDRSNLIGKNLIESNLRRDYGVIIVLLRNYRETSYSIQFQQKNLNLTMSS